MTTDTLRRTTAKGITVKIIAMGKGITNYVTSESVALGRVLEELRFGADMDVRVNGMAMEKEYLLADGDQVLVVPKVRGG